MPGLLHCTFCAVKINDETHVRGSSSSDMLASFVAHRSARHKIIGQAQVQRWAPRRSAVELLGFVLDDRHSYVTECDEQSFRRA